MKEAVILTNQVYPGKNEVCTTISKYRLKSITPVMSFCRGTAKPAIAEFNNVNDAVNFCQVFDKIEVDGFTVKLPKMPKYKPMAEKGMIKRPLSLDEAREQMILIGAS